MLRREPLSYLCVYEFPYLASQCRFYMYCTTTIQCRLLWQPFYLSCRDFVDPIFYILICTSIFWGDYLTCRLHELILISSLNWYPLVSSSLHLVIAFGHVGLIILSPRRGMSISMLHHVHSLTYIYDCFVGNVYHTDRLNASYWPLLSNELQLTIAFQLV